MAQSIVETCRRAPAVRSSTVDREQTPSAPGRPGAFLSFDPSPDLAENAWKTDALRLGQSSLGNRSIKPKKRAGGKLAGD